VRDVLGRLGRQHGCAWSVSLGCLGERERGSGCLRCRRRPRPIMHVDLDRRCGARAGRVRMGRQWVGVEEEGACGFVVEGVSSSVLVVERGRCERSSLAGTDVGETGQGRLARPLPRLLPARRARLPADRPLIGRECDCAAHARAGDSIRRRTPEGLCALVTAPAGREAGVSQRPAAGSLTLAVSWKRKRAAAFG
jgi:hypothetical protein